MVRIGPHEKPKMDIDSNILGEALKLLGQFLPPEEEYHFVVCGGSSLIALGLIHRTTQDVDVLARIDTGELQLAKPLPTAVVKAAKQVADELKLDPDWFNAKVSDKDFFRLGLPEGLAERLTERVYTTNLTVSYISRLDQIHLKLYAAVDRGDTQLADLISLAPTREETLAAARWTRTHDPSEGFRMGMFHVLKELGYHDLDQHI